MHSPQNGIGILKSRDLVHFEDAAPVNFLSQGRWVWAKDRITAGFVLDLTQEPDVGMYLLFYHGDNERNGEFPFGASIGMAVTKDMKNYITFEAEEPAYPNLGNIYEGDYYKGIPYEEYIDKSQEPLQMSPERPVFDIRSFGAVAVPGRVNTAAFPQQMPAVTRAAESFLYRMVIM